MQKLSSKECFSWLRNYAVLILLLLPLVVLAAGPTQRITGDLAVSGSVRVGLENVTPLEGMVAYDSVNHELAVYNGTAWQKVFDAANLTGTLPPGLLHCSDLADATGSCSTANASANTPSTLVARDASGNFSAATVTAALTGVASGNLKATANNHGILISSGTNTATVLAPDASTTKILTSGGTGADPTWQPSPVSMPTTTLGDIPYEDATPAPARLPGNITTTKKFLTQTGNGSISAAPGWNTIAAGDVPTLNQNTTGTAAGNLSGTPSNHGMLISSGTNAVTVLAPDASTTKVWTSGGVSADPSWQPPAGGLLGPGSSTSTAFARWNGTAGTTLQDSVFLGASTGILTTTGDTAGMTMASVTDTTASGSLAIDHNSTSLLLKSLESSTNAGYSLGLSTATIAGANANGTGAINLTTGDKSAGTGNSGGITLTTGATTGGARGRITFADGSEGNAPGAVWTVSGNSGSGHWVSPSEKNYIANPDANIQSASATPAGWANYFDAAGTAPVDCTGGSPVTALTRNTSSPIGPTTDFRWTKSATSRQGEGFSYDFTIDKTDQAKVMKVAFDYSVPSGTFVPGTPTTDSDMTVWLFDVTNAVLIQPSTYKLFSSTTSPPAGFDTTFQTASNSTSYRICVHTGTTSASAYTLALRNFEAKRARYTYGTPITDWTPFTPTGSWTTSTTYTGLWRRVGGMMEIQAHLAFTGIPDATNLTINMPTGYTIDSSPTRLLGSVGTTNPLGRGGQIRIATNYFPEQVFYNSTSSVSIFEMTGTPVNAGTPVTKTAPATIASGDYMDFWWSVPILGWSSTVQMSDSAPQGPGEFKVNPATPTGTISSSYNDISWGAATYDTDGGWNGTTTYTVKRPGYYKVVAGAEYTASFALSGYAEIAIAINGTAVNSGFEKTWATATTTIMPRVSGGFQLKSGDTIKIQSNTSGTTPTYVTNSPYNYFTISRSGDSSTIGATDDVGAYYTGAPPTGTLANAFNITTFGTKVDDTHGAYSAGTYTVPAPGRYSACASTQQTATYALGSVADTAIYINGVDTAEGVAVAGGAVGTLYPHVCIHDQRLKTGDLVTVRSLNNGTTPTLGSAPTVNFFSIIRTGI